MSEDDSCIEDRQVFESKFEVLRKIYLEYTKLDSFSDLNNSYEINIEKTIKDIEKAIKNMNLNCQTHADLHSKFSLLKNSFERHVKFYKEEKEKKNKKDRSSNQN